MKWNRDAVKEPLLVLCGAGAFYAALQHLGAVAAALEWLIGILAPFLLGAGIAFILNVPMRAIENALFPRAKRGAAARRPLALVLTLTALVGVLVLASCVIAPGVRGAVRTIAAQAPAALDRLSRQLLQLEQYLPQIQDIVSALDIDWASLSQKAVQQLQTWGGSLLSSGGGLMLGMVSGVSTFVIALVFSFYILLQKEQLARQCRKALYALLPLRRADQALEVARLAGRTFSSFLSGQCTEAVILGGLFVVSMTVLRLPYAVLVGVLVALTALIPIVGAFIGCGVGALLIAVTDPWKAVVFVILFLALQQIEGNLIYPHVVGSSVGLPSIWVLAAVTLGGKLMGTAGMVFFIPLCSVLYALFRRFVARRLREKQVPDDKWNGPSS